MGMVTHDGSVTRRRPLRRAGKPRTKICSISEHRIISRKL
jgi:hypothetical protein